MGTRSLVFFVQEFGELPPGPMPSAIRPRSHWVEETAPRRMVALLYRSHDGWPNVAGSFLGRALRQALLGRAAPHLSIEYLATLTTVHLTLAEPRVKSPPCRISMGRYCLTATSGWDVEGIDYLYSVAGAYVPGEGHTLEIRCGYNPMTGEVHGDPEDLFTGDLDGFEAFCESWDE